MKAVLDLPENRAQVLIFLLEKINPSEYSWALTGSAGLRLQGVDLSVNDIDLQTDRATIYLIEKNLSEFIKTPVHVWESEHTLSLHGQAQINGLQVELLGDIQHRDSNGKWESPLAIETVRVWVEWRGYNVPALSLNHEALAYERMGRAQKSELIRSMIGKETL